MSGPDPLIAPLLAPVESLPGIGPVLAGAIARATGGRRVLDLLFHLPESIVDRRAAPPLAEARHDSVVTATVTVRSVEKPGGRRQPLRVLATDGTREIELVYFNSRPEWLAHRFAPGAVRRISGKLQLHAGRLSMPHPDYVEPPDTIPPVDPVWPLTAGLTRRHLARAMRAALDRLPTLPEWHGAALLRREGWPAFDAALRAIQAPEAPPPAAARRRLAYDEILAGQLALALVRREGRRRPGRALVGPGHLRQAALMAFGHAPTPSQTAALAEIDADLAAPHRMVRLLQGDVGAGKTLVAVLAMLRAVEAGAQAALMAPTELLARQHLRTLWRLCEPAGVDVRLLAGSVKGTERRNVLRRLADGSLPLVVGTHALFQEAVEFRDLGLAVVDEQHRFGVDQRLELAGKGATADLLVMTATPIPRTLLLTQWGEMEVSRLAGKPAGRQPIRTTLHGLRQVPEVVAAIGRAIGRGAQVYWVCPHVAENESTDIAAAEARHADLAKVFGEGAVGLAHGRLDTDPREAALAAFAAGRTRILVATTVIEVGVDVPGATVMVIEHAERFGLAQLHQLRGRVGRGSGASFCMLLYDEGLGHGARERLAVLRDTEDGFLIADTDFRLRGGGDALGTRQAGMEAYRLADPQQDADLFAIAHKDAALLLEKDPPLESPRGRAARLLLAMFGKDRAMETLKAG
ncbi:ATP-dependent DNA helicase RecG [Roseomonas sp. NAR14]|uniref:Probable DNA 3'-5' helicase RecG n=1 Tax=Roseomonas acroporae TaxID=2937791 RepID=A0A9X2BS84_9PROT|nr:ATP-dependent DNA helicase RecG [Roseomonas acroporae]MCK8782862.1 ATP-dependent DNA helicase RecG [Roseomonas acroporae]